MPRGEDVLHENHIANKHQNQVRWRGAGTGGGPWRGSGRRVFFCGGGGGGGMRPRVGGGGGHSGTDWIPTGKWLG